MSLVVSLFALALLMASIRSATVQFTVILVRLQASDAVCNNSAANANRMKLLLNMVAILVPDRWPSSNIGKLC